MREDTFWPVANVSSALTMRMGGQVMTITGRDREMYRWMIGSKAEQLSDEALDQYIRTMRFRLKVFMPIFLLLVGTFFYVFFWVIPYAR